MLGINHDAITDHKHPILGVGHPILCKSKINKWIVIMEQPTKYDLNAKKYSAIFLEESQKSIDIYHSQFEPDLTDRKILDLGCGDGHDLKLFCEQGAIAYGVDASLPMVSLALKNTKNKTEVKEAYFDNLPFQDNFFDVVCSKYALQASPDIQPIYQEVNRVLKPGGAFIFLVGHPIYQFLEKRKHPKNYFLKEMIDVKIFKGRFEICEPTHTLSEYLSPYFIRHFELNAYIEEAEDSIDRIDGDIYPAFLLIRSTKKGFLV